MKKGAKAGGGAATATVGIEDVASKKPPATTKEPAKRGPRKNAKKDEAGEKPAPTPKEPKEKKSSSTATKKPVSAVNTLMNYIKPAAGNQEAGAIKTLSTNVVSSLKQKKSATSSKSTANLIPEPPNQRDLLRIIDSKEMRRARLAEVDVKKLIESWESDADDFELFDLKTSFHDLSPKRANSVREKSLEEETKSIIEKYERIYLDLTRDLPTEDEEDERNSDRVNLRPPQPVASVSRQHDVSLMSKTSQHLNSIINDTVEISSLITTTTATTTTTTTTTTSAVANTNSAGNSHALINQSIRTKPQITMVRI